MSHSKKIISIHQPNYIPWLPFFYKISKSDVFVYHDDVMFSKRGRHNFHNIKTPQGLHRIKIPVAQKEGYLINEVRTKDELGWKKKHLTLIQMNYKRAPFFEEVYTDFEKLINKEYPNIAVQNQEIITFICRKLGFDVEFIVASELKLNSVKEEKVIDLCNVLNADVYYSGNGAKAYQKEENFAERGIQLEYENFKMFEYKQLWSEFEHDVTILDFLMNCGYNWQIVEENQKSKIEINE